MRCLDHDLVRALACENGPLATTSANRHGEATPPTAAAVAEVFGTALGLVLDGGRAPSRCPRWSTPPARPGGPEAGRVTQAELAAAAADSHAAS